LGTTSWETWVDMLLRQGCSIDGKFFYRLGK
jgi:hypothetical protein